MRFMIFSHIVMMDHVATIMLLRGQPTKSSRQDTTSLPFIEMPRDALHNVMSIRGWGNLLRGMCWLSGSQPRFRVKFSKQIPTLMALSASTSEVRTEVSPEAVWGDAGTNFLHQEVSVMLFNTLNLPLHRSMSP